MESKLKQITAQTEQGPEQKFIVDGCKVTVRYSGQKSPHRIREMKSLLLSAKFPAKKD